MKVRIEFGIDNAAFDDFFEDEVTRMVEQFREQYLFWGWKEGNLHDSNGNNVGFWTEEV